MAPTPQDDGAEDVADFLERIRELGKRSKEEGGERSKKLDEEILQGRKEREARRAERARSISPTKDSPITTPSRKAGPSSPLPPTGSPTPMFKPAPPHNMANAEPRKSTEVVFSDKAIPKTLSLNLDLEPSKPSPPPTSTLARTGTLSWQQRPSSRGASSRPTSLLTLDNKTTLSPRDSPAPEAESKEPSMSDVARALERKDPTWFKQTADRSSGSAALRRSQENDAMERAGSNVQLPGMSYRNSGSTEALSSIRSSLDSTQQDHTLSTRKSFTIPPLSGTRSPLLSTSAQTFEPAADSVTRKTEVSSLLSGSTTQRNISPERSVSPTKGLGGFVQSAMLKRSDSLNKHKRAGSQVTSSLSRNNSVAKEPHGGRTEGAKEIPKALAIDSQNGATRQTDTEPSLSPSKTFDTRRWSPTKQSWLEGAILKSETPRPKSTSIQSPPMWLSELQKSKDLNSSTLETVKPKVDNTVGGSSSLRPAKDISNQASQPPTILATKNHQLPVNSEMNQASRTKESAEQPDAKNKASINKPSDPPAQTASLNNGAKADVLKSKPIPPPVTSPKPESHRFTTATSDVTKPVFKSPELDSGKFSIPEQKAKSEVPGKRDFRAGLRSTKDLDQKPKTEEPEFKNVFGKLKKTETKNFVAPDELKENILRGKTGLNTTGGPRPFQKKDEFKDSILKKKEEMKAGFPIKAKSPELASTEPVPEAIARRQKLGQRGLEGNTSDTSKATVEMKPGLSRTKSAFESNTPKSSMTSKPTIAAKPEAIRKVSLNKPNDAKVMNDTTSTATFTVKHSMTQVEEPKPIPLEKKTSAPAQLQNTATSNAFANRFNPALASILARGPPSTTNTTPNSPQMSVPSPIERERTAIKDSPETSSSQLSHATKGRAKGPKRRAPGAVKTEKERSEEASTPAKLPPSKGLINVPVSGISLPPKALEKETDKPQKKLNNGTVSEPTESHGSITKSPPPVGTKPLALTALSPKPKPPAQVSTKPTSPVATKSTATLPKPSVSNNDAVVAEKSPISPLKSPKSPPTPGDKARAMARISSNGATAERLQIPGGTLTDFFDNISTTKSDTDFDTQALLTNTTTHSTKTRTLQREINEIASDGKRSPLTPQQEHILFEDKMYLCRHRLEDANGKQATEVFLWSGDLVAPAAVEDVQVFCRAEARNANCKLQNLSQGKESADFLNALGGIVVVRRNNSATYMLCGRRHLGHVVFDEVDFSAESLCPGFAFIIAMTDNSLYLWKGCGANADEIGCARLIGMDLGLIDEIKEIQEGNEPAELLNVLGLEHKTLTGNYWSNKATVDNYACRLFVIETDARPWSASSLSNFAVNIWKRRGSSPSPEETNRSSIKEISPFAQSDISEDKIFVLDTFFEIWVIVGSQTRSRFIPFVQALSFAQDYGMLSVSIQDRPCLPQSNVLFLGATGTIPISVRTAFRKWDDRFIKQQNSWAPATVCMSLHNALRALESLTPGV